MNVEPLRRRRPFLHALLALAWLAPLGGAHAAAEYDPWRGRAAAPATDRVIVKLRAQASDRVQAQAATDRVGALAQRAGILLRDSRRLYDDVHVARIDGIVTPATLRASIAKLAADSSVEYVVPDARMRAHVTPNDTLFTGTPGSIGRTGQWYMQAPVSTPVGTTTSATNAIAAWDVTTGSPDVVVAVLDTGARFEHPDLKAVAAGGKLLPGRDFVGLDSSGGTLTANDGDGWDANAADPGDWINTADQANSLFTDCDEGPSSWHGTRVSGIVGALSNNGVGVAGFGWGTRILPVRVLGKCGGYVSDIITAMRWSAGLAVGGNVPLNPTPAKVLNLSLGGTADACSAAYQSAIDEVVARGVLVVVSAGNEGTALDQPANCNGVVAVTAVRHIGTKVGFANLGRGTTIAAPGGNCYYTGAGEPCLFTIDTTTNVGATTPDADDYTNQQRANVGTSFSAPIVAGIASLMYAVNPGLTPAQTRARLQASARAFPKLAQDETGTGLIPCRIPVNATEAQTSQCNCTKWTCGAGLADAAQAVGGMTSPIAAFSISGTPASGASVTLDASPSSAGAGAGALTYAWSVGAGSGGTFSSATAATTSLTLPAAGAFAVRLTVQDSRAISHSTVVNVLSAVPALAGLLAGGVVDALENADLALRGVTLQPSATVPAGAVITQLPAAGAIVASGTPVDIVISDGARNVTVPNVAGQTQAAASTSITNVGLVVGTITNESSASVASGVVISQTPAGGTSAVVGSSVALVVSSGPAQNPGGGFGGGGGGGGGGSLDPATLALGALAAFYARRRRRAPR